MSNVQAQTRVLVLAGRALMQKSQATHEMISELQSKIDALETEVYSMFGGLDDELRNLMYLLNGIPLEPKESKRQTDLIEDTISNFWFGSEVNEQEFFEKFNSELNIIKKDLE